MTQDIPGTLLLDPNVIEDPYPFYRRLRAEAPVWEIPGTRVFTVSTFELLAEAVGRVDDFSSHIKCLLYRNDAGLPDRFAFGDTGGQVLATADPPVHAVHRSTVFPELVAKRMRELADRRRRAHRFAGDQGARPWVCGIHDRDRQPRAYHDHQSPHRLP